MDTINWLLSGDPAISWQAMQDLTDATPDEVTAERARVAHEGIGAAALACQGVDGPWHLANEPDWLPTLYTMLLLRATRVDPADPVVRSAIERLEAGYRWDQEFGAKTFFEGEVEPCINGGALASSAYFGHASESLMRRLLSEQLEDGGWNCDAPKSLRSSFHSTICVLEGLLEYERAVGPSPEVTDARRRGEDYLLKRGLFRRLSSGQVANPEFLKFAFPPRYHYDVLRALDYLRAAGVKPDTRIDEAMDVVKSKRQADGRWLLEESYLEALPLPVGELVGEPSAWNTLRAMRVLRWYERE